MGVAQRTLTQVRVAPAAWVLEASAVAGLVVLAVGTRLPELMAVPRFTDEAAEVMLALRIARGEAAPLTFNTPFIGAFFHYLVAGAFRLLGPSLEAGRLTVLVLGALTVVPTYLLGRSIGEVRVGLLAALLLAVSAAHIAVNSHIAWSNCASPLFTTSALWLLHEAVKRRSGPRLALSGAAFGLALQTHPSPVTLAPGLAVYLLWQGRALLGRWSVAAAGLGLLMLWNVVLFNVAGGLRAFAVAADKSSRYTVEGGAAESWAERLVVLLRSLAAGLGGLVSESDSAAAAIFHPVVATFVGLALVGLYLLARRREHLPVLAVLSLVLVMPLFNGRYEPIVTKARHFAPLLPVGFVAVGVALERLVAVEWTGLDARPWLRRLVAGAGLVLIGCLALAQLALLEAYYDRAYREGRTNGPVLQALEAIDRELRRGETVYVDRGLLEVQTMAAGRLLNHLRLGVEVGGRQLDSFEVERDALPLGRAPGAWRLLVLRSDHVALAERRYRLAVVSGDPGPDAPLRVVRASAY